MSTSYRYIIYAQQECSESAAAIVKPYCGAVEIDQITKSEICHLIESATLNDGHEGL